ncbi:uncharacterized protein ACHE_60092S [Aspergillus chevalieri]|uniref:Uncharacterized protein n=1 Tax=Aspergillus chevalieri TaxID=182096 RepID=A0A7R7VSX7_ASPCH|nr:uncharacterized protein ACHE_60092S [Aspergillus chevalieri]BCR90206.1 hypothetical protein ACHE_60092S [Aspergillus chevalieri]
MVNFMGTTIALQVLLAPHQTVPFTSLLPIEVSIHNAASTPVTILDRNTPLEPGAGHLGVLKLRDAQTYEEVPIATISASRIEPPLPNEYIEIPPDTTVKRTLELRVDEKDIQVGREYTVRAEGLWSAVWYRALSEIMEEQRDHSLNATTGEFLSNVGRVKVE